MKILWGVFLFVSTMVPPNLLKVDLKGHGRLEHRGQVKLGGGKDRKP